MKSIMRPVGIGSRPVLHFTREDHLPAAKSRSLSCVPRAQSSPDNPENPSYKDLSPAAREVFKEAQANILALNESRVRALRELKAANEKIADLEKRLEDAARQITTLAARHGGGRENAVPQSPVVPPPQSQNSTPPSTTASAPPSLITLFYSTGWDAAYLHFQVDDQPWTTLPGVKMEQELGEHSSKKMVSVAGSNMRFVLTNGAGKFDTPNPYGDPHKPKNYSIDAPGMYLLEGGEVTVKKEN